MKPLIINSLVVLAMLLGMTTAGMALPDCVGSWSITNWKNCFGTYTFSNGDKYLGEHKNGKMHGQGTYIYANGGKYVGAWENDKKHGYGTVAWDNGDKYVGEYKNNKMHGQGTKIWGPNSKWAGEKYVGEVKNGNMHGQGTYTFASGDKYVGEYKDNKINGRGIYIFSNGAMYAGEYKDGKKHGQGIYTYASGNKYVGEFKDDKENGQGTHTRADGNKYVGEFKNGKRNGQGTYNWKDGRIWVGKWKNSELNGYAIKYYASGSINKEGIFKDGKFLYAQNSKHPPCPSDQTEHYHDCYGTYVFANGNKYVGEFKNHKMHGQGITTYGPNSKWAGDKYVGEYKHNKYYGQGTYTYVSGNKYVGEFKEGKRNGKGTFTYVSGDKYVGEYKDDKKYGQGTYTFKSGIIWVGEWKNSELNGYAIKYYASGDINKEGIFKDGKFLYAQNSKNLPCPSDQTENYHDCYGTYVFANGNKYVGEFKEGKRHGQGTFTWVDGEKYVGEYKKGKQSGQGTNFFKNGAKYIGEYKDGKWHGQGTYYWADGRKDVGIFENNKLNGYAITYHADGSIDQDGIFKDDKFLFAQNGSSNKNQNTCNEDPTLCTIVQLCSKASNYSNGKKNWNTNYSSKKYVIEAEKNGLTCGINSEIVQSNIDEILPAASGSGFFVTKDGHIITNEHVIEGCQTVKVHQQGISYTSKILSADKFNDLALIKIEYNPKIVFSLAIKPPYLGQDLIAAGYPLVSDLGNSLKVTSGIVSALSAIDDTSKFQMDVPVQPGNSGGPIFDVNGNILGVVVARSTHKETQLVNFGIKAATVRNLLDSNNIKLLPPKIEPINKREFSKAMTQGTVLLSCWMTLTQIEKAKANSLGKVLFKEFQK